MNFASDNAVGTHPALLAAIAAANDGAVASYGADDLTTAALERLDEVFERDVAAYFVLTGTAANALALSSLCPPWGAIVSHRDAHIQVDESGACEHATGGARLIGLAGVNGKLTVEALDGFMAGHVRGDRDPLPQALSITQATECGTLYSPREIARLADAARGHGMRLHMDGARFANAVAALEASPAELTWKAGVDVLSFGATKNGALALEAVIFFDPALAEHFNRRRIRAGQLLSKGRYLGAQMLAYLENDLWLDNARHANAMARRLADGLAGVPDVRLPLPVEANELFPVMPRTMHRALGERGVIHHPWPGDVPPGTIAEHELMTRFVTSFATRPEDVDRTIELIVTASRT